MPLQFPARKIQPMPFDAAAHALSAVDEALRDLDLAIADAYEAKDLNALHRLNAEIGAVVLALQTRETMALEYADKVNR